MDGPRTLGQIIRSRRQFLGLTQEELAARIGGGMRQAEVSRLESDRIALPRRQRLERIAAALGMPIGELLAGAGWSGAETAFQPERETRSSAKVDMPTGFPPPTSRTGDPSATETVHLRSKLREALDQSRELRLRTSQLLELSSELATVWWNGSDTRRNRRDDS